MVSEPQSRNMIASSDGRHPTNKKLTNKVAAADDVDHQNIDERTTITDKKSRLIGATPRVVRGRGLLSNRSSDRRPITLLRSKRCAAVPSETLANDDDSVNNCKQKVYSAFSTTALTAPVNDEDDDGNVSSAGSQVTIIENDDEPEAEEDSNANRLPQKDHHQLSAIPVQTNVADVVMPAAMKTASVPRRFADRSANIPNDVYFREVDGKYKYNRYWAFSE